MFQYKNIGNNTLKCIFLETDSDEETYISISFGSGYGDRLISENNEMKWIGGGSSNILTNIKKEQLQKKFPGLELNVQVTMDTSTINIKIKEDSFKDILDSILEVLFMEKITAEAFKQQKDKSAYDFEVHIKNPAFNSMMDIQQYAIPNRLFNTELVHQDLKDVLYEDILLLNDTLFRPENAVVIIGYNDQKFSEIRWLENKIDGMTAGKRNVHHVYKQNNYKNTVKHIYDSKEERSIGALLIRNRPIDYKIEMEMIYLQAIGILVFQENYYVNIGKDYASIVYENRKEIDFIHKLSSAKISERDFFKARDQYYASLQHIKTNDAGKFAYLLSQYSVKDINLFRIMNMFGQGTYESFMEYIQSIKIRLTETKIIYSEGG